MWFLCNKEHLVLSVLYDVKPKLPWLPLGEHISVVEDMEYSLLLAQGSSFLYISELPSSTPLVLYKELTCLLCNLLLSGFPCSVELSPAAHVGHVHEACASAGQRRITPCLAYDMPIHTGLHTVCLLQSKMPLLLKFSL